MSEWASTYYFPPADADVHKKSALLRCTSIYTDSREIPSAANEKQMIWCYGAMYALISLPHFTKNVTWHLLHINNSSKIRTRKLHFFLDGKHICIVRLKKSAKGARERQPQKS